jgi:ankyrin repeat protein
MIIIYYNSILFIYLLSLIMLLSKKLELYKSITARNTKMEYIVNNSLFVENNNLCALIQNNDIENLKEIFLKSPSYINITDCYGNTLMHYAILYEKPDIIKLLCNYPPINLNINNKNEGNTAMHLIFMVTHNISNFDNLINILDIIAIFIHLKGNLRTVNNYGKTPIYYFEKVINKQDMYGNTLLMYAINLKRFNIVRILINIGADVNKQNHENNTALHYIALQIYNDFNNIELFYIMTYLLKYGAIECKNIYGQEPFMLLSKILLK